MTWGFQRYSADVVARVICRGDREWQFLWVIWRVGGGVYHLMGVMVGGVLLKVGNVNQ